MNAAHKRDARSFGLRAITARPSAAHAAAIHARMIVRAGSPGFEIDRRRQGDSAPFAGSLDRQRIGRGRLTVEIRSDLAVSNPLVAIPIEHDVAGLQQAVRRAVAANLRHQERAGSASQRESEVLPLRRMGRQHGNHVEQQDAEGYAGSKH